MATRSATINVMIRAADRAARGLKRDFGEVANLQVSRKGPADFVSAADLRAEQVLRALVDRVICPIGLPGIDSKQPAVIAVAVAAQILLLPAENGRNR